MYSPRVGRFFAMDPLAKKYSFQSPYAFATNNPVRLVDIDGLGPDDPKKKGQIANEYTYKGNGKHKLKQTEVVNSTTQIYGKRGGKKIYKRTITKQITELNFTLSNDSGKTIVKEGEFISYCETTTEFYYKVLNPTSGDIDENITNSYSKISNLKHLTSKDIPKSHSMAANVDFIDNAQFILKINELHNIGINRLNSEISIKEASTSSALSFVAGVAAFAASNPQLGWASLFLSAPSAGNSVGNELRKKNIITHAILWKNY